MESQFKFLYFGPDDNRCFLQITSIIDGQSVFSEINFPVDKDYVDKLIAALSNKTIFYGIDNLIQDAIRRAIKLHDFSEGRVDKTALSFHPKEPEDLK